MTEFIISAGYVLIPLLLGISLLAKYIDMRQAAIQSARYEAWEYTVWYENNSQPSTGFNAVSQPVKSASRTKREARRRFYSDVSETGTLPIRDDDHASQWTNGVKNRLWVNHRGVDLYDGSDGTGVGTGLATSQDTPSWPIVEDVMNILLEVVDAAFSAIGSILSLIGSSVGFSAINADGYVVSTTSLEATSVPEFVRIHTLEGGDDLDVDFDTTGRSGLIFSATASVLSDGWNAGGVEHTYNQAGGTVPTVLLKELLTLPVLSTIWDVVAILAPELRRCHPSFIYPEFWGNPDAPTTDKGSLWLGHIDIDAVHPDRLSGGGTHSCDDAGRCEFEPAIPRVYDCIP